ncbi:MAG: helix-turn-helix domain-containing protein [Anaeroplasmataceae bacterium]|nr:helix-turn-helix domain-containing protein [Anaeroplasmataceae bacterium]MDE6414995.1 helix-turn-helix domain-containing protein [Anaeroplasmataceae bacterium]
MSRTRNDENPIQVQNFSEFISKYIVDNNLSNTAFAKMIGVDEATVRKYRSGIVLPSHSKMQTILTVTHTRYHEALGFVDPKLASNEGKN